MPIKCFMRKCFPVWVHYVKFPSAIYERCHFSASWPAFGAVTVFSSFFFLSYFHRYVVNMWLV